MIEMYTCHCIMLLLSVLPVLIGALVTVTKVGVNLSDLI